MNRSDNVQAMAFNECETGPIQMLALAKSNGAQVIQIVMLLLLVRHR